VPALGDIKMIDEGDAMDEEDEQKEQIKAFRPGIDEMEDGDELVYDRSAYHVNQSFYLEWPCLSFDILRDSLGFNRTGYPFTMYAVSGTQADELKNNRLYVVKISDIEQIADDEDDDGLSDDDEDATLHYKYFNHDGGVNRVRSMPQQANIVATWADTGKVHVWDIAPLVTAVDAEDPSQQRVPTASPGYTFEGHADEGFAMDWSQKDAGKLLTGDCAKNIYAWHPQQGGTWQVDNVPYIGHTDSIEDLAWSPNESSVFASCSADKTVRIWDLRTKRNSMLTVQAHDTDVNVISWNTMVSHLMLSGADDGTFRIWDLRNFKADSPAAHFKWHTSPITSVEWHPTEDAMLAVSEAAQATTIWDMSLEKDEEEDAEAVGGDAPDVPPALLFEHMGQNDVKELHWHPQIPGLLVTTASDGFSVFKACNV